MRGYAWAEAEFEDITEFALLVALCACSVLAGPSFRQIHGGIYRWLVFTWRLLLDKLAEGVANPPVFLFDVAIDRFGVHGRML